MDEDDLLGGELHRKQDLRHKIQRSMRVGPGDGGRFDSIPPGDKPQAEGLSRPTKKGR